MNLESAFPHECPAGTSNSIHPEETHYWWPYYSSPLLMVPRAVNGLAFIQSPAVQSPVPFLTFLSAFHPTYNYSLVFSNSVRKTRIIFSLWLPLPLLSGLCHLSPGHWEQLQVLACGLPCGHLLQFSL